VCFFTQLTEDISCIGFSSEKKYLDWANGLTCAQAFTVVTSRVTNECEQENKQHDITIGNTCKLTSHT